MLSVALSFSCSEDETEPKTRCLYGIDTGGVRYFMRCCTKQQYLAGSNVAAGGTANWNNYPYHEWKECDRCK